MGCSLILRGIMAIAVELDLKSNPINIHNDENNQDKYIEHLEKTRALVREELLQRMKQRDTYSIEMTVVIGALGAIGIAISSDKRLEPILLLILIVTPFLALYFTKLIMYSYRVSQVLGDYMKNYIEPQFINIFQEYIQIAPINSVNNLENRSLWLLQSEWESYRDTRSDTMDRGVRKFFFLYSMLGIFFVDIGASFLYVHYKQANDVFYKLPLLCIIITLLVAYFFILKDELREFAKQLLQKIK